MYVGRGSHIYIENNDSAEVYGGLGFRDIELVYLAFVARHAWCLLISPMSLFARLLKSVYFPTGELLHAEFGSKPSKTWRAIYDGIDVLKQGLIRRIGDGVSTSIWGT